MPNNHKSNPPHEDLQKTRLHKAIKISLVVFIAGIIIAASVLLIIYCIRNQDKAIVIRDVIVIMLGLLAFIAGVAVTILIIQLAILINLINNEVIPIIESAKETVNMLHGTSKFVSKELVEPVIKLNSYLAGLKKLLSIFHIIKK